MRIKKTSQYIDGGANLSNVYGTSNENGYTQEYINGLETYSTDEVRIGTWFGKPLYRKVIQDTIPTTTGGVATTKTIDLNNTTIELCMIPKAYMKIYNNQTRMIPYIQSSNEFINVYYLDSTNQLVIRSTFQDASGYPIIIVIEYTKTTD